MCVLAGKAVGFSISSIPVIGRTAFIGVTIYQGIYYPEIIDPRSDQIGYH
jgi:hypothetical protein